MPRRLALSSGSRIFIDEGGRGRPILAVHGLGGGAWFFSGLGRRLAGEYRVAAVDLPGTGRSTTGGPMSIETWSRDLREVAASFGEPAIFMGHSMGAILALYAAAAWPELLGGVIFVGGLPEPLPHIKERLAARAETAAREGMEGVGAAVSAANFSPAVQTGQPELVALFERLFEAQDAGTYAQCCRILMGASASHLVSGMAVPALSISGMDDQYAPPELVRAFAGAVAGCESILLPDCGHFPFLEQPDAFAAAVRDWLVSTRTS